jgi:hypothetical protein
MSEVCIPDELYSSRLAGEVSLTGRGMQEDHSRKCRAAGRTGSSGLDSRVGRVTPRRVEQAGRAGLGHTAGHPIH